MQYNITRLAQIILEIVNFLEDFAVKIPQMIESLEIKNFKKILITLNNNINQIIKYQLMLDKEMRDLKISLNRYLENTERKIEKIL